MFALPQLLEGLKPFAWDEARGSRLRLFLSLVITQPRRGTSCVEWTATRREPLFSNVLFDGVHQGLAANENQVAITL